MKNVSDRNSEGDGMTAEQGENARQARIPRRNDDAVIRDLRAQIERLARKVSPGALTIWRREPGIPGDQLYVIVPDPDPPLPPKAPPKPAPELFTLTQLAEYTGLSKRQIRYFSKRGVGLVWPRNHKAPRGQPKLYNRAAARRLLVCMDLRAQGMNLAQIREYFMRRWQTGLRGPFPEAFEHPPWTTNREEIEALGKG